MSVLAGKQRFYDILNEGNVVIAAYEGLCFADGIFYEFLLRFGKQRSVSSCFGFPRGVFLPQVSFD